MKSPTRRVLLGAAALLVVGAGAAVAAAAVSPSGRDSATSAATASADPSTPSAQPTDDLAVRAPSAPPAQSLEPRPGEEVATDPTSSTGVAGSVDVVVTSAEQEGDEVVVYGFVQGVVTDSGTCTVTVSRPGAADVVVSGTAFADATTTGCDPLSVPVDPSAAGPWSVVLSYSSASASGASQPTAVSVTR